MYVTGYSNHAPNALVWCVLMDRIRVLVVDKYPAFQEGLCRRLDEEEDIKVVSQTHDATEAVRLASELMPDVVFIDYSISRTGDINITQQIKKFCPTVAIIIIDSFPSEKHLLISLHAGAKAYLRRETSLEKLIESIHFVYCGDDVVDMKTTSSILHRLANESLVNGKGCKLNNRELKIIKYAASGMHNKDIAKIIALSERTVQSDLKIIFDKLGVNSRTEAAMYALR